MTWTWTFGSHYSCAELPCACLLLSGSVDHVLRAVWLCALERSASVFVASDHVVDGLSLFLSSIRVPLLSSVFSISSIILFLVTTCANLDVKDVGYVIVSNQSTC